MKQHGLPRALRMRRRREFVRAQQGGTKLHARHFMVFAMRSLGPVPAAARAGAAAAHAGASGAEAACAASPALPAARLGITVTRKVGPAVVRNRIKRWVREAFRRAAPSWAAAMGRATDAGNAAGASARGVDLVFVAKRSAPAASYAEVVSDLESIAVALGRSARRGRDERRRPG